MNYIITKNQNYFKKIGNYNYCSLGDMILPDIIAFDSETTGLIVREEDVFCIQIGTKVNNYLIVMYNDDYIFEDLIPYIENKTLVIHNALFDLKFCYKHNFFPKEVKDTMLASKILYNGDFAIKKHDFKSVMQRELKVEYDKTEQKNIHKVKLSQPSTIEYSFNDVDKLIQLKDKLEEKINKGEYTETYNLHNNYIKALAYIEMCGMPISSKRWLSKIEEDKLNANNYKTLLEQYIYNNIEKYRNNQLDLFAEDKKIKVSLTSPIQMIKIFKELGIPCTDKDGKDSINESIISKSKHEFVKLWLDYQEANHRVTTFGKSIYDKIEEERIYTEFNPMVDTARLSSRKGSINFLNFPSDYKTRECFEANEGNVIIVCDYSGQETVIAADLSGDKAMTDSVINNSDLHCAFARVLFPEIQDLSDDEIKKNHKDKRSASKAPRFAFSYGGNAYTIHQSSGTPYEEAVQIELAFKELHSGLYEWGNRIFDESIKTGYIKSADGWKLKLPKYEQFSELKKFIEGFERSDWDSYKQGKQEYNKKWELHNQGKNYDIKYANSYNFYVSNKKGISEFFKLKSEYQRLCLNNPVQTGGAHQLKYATCLLFKWILESNLLWKVKIVNSVHDELVVECAIELSELVRKKVEEFMIMGGNKYLKNLKIKADAAIGNSWASAKN